MLHAARFIVHGTNGYEAGYKRFKCREESAVFYLIDPRAETGELLGKVVGEALPTLRSAIATCAAREQCDLGDGRSPMFPRIIEIHAALDQGSDVRISEVARLFNHAGVPMPLFPWPRQRR